MVRSFRSSSLACAAGGAGGELNGRDPAALLPEPPSYEPPREP